METYFKKSDERGRYWSNALTGAGTRNGESGKPWRGFNPTAKGRHWAVPGVIAEELGIEDLTLLEKLDAMHEAGFINIPVNTDSMPEYRQYLHHSKGMLLQDIWAYQPHTKGCVAGSDECIDEDVRWIGKRGDPERLEYPTQKPLGLLERILTTSSNEGDVVLDPFCGCGTAVHAAQRLKRKWIGIDITHLAIAVIEKRLKSAFGARCKFEVIGTPGDLDAARDLATRDKYQFQWWAVSLVEAQPFQGKKKGADGGIDGLKFFRDLDKKEVRKILVSVKGGDNVGPTMVKDLIATLARDKAEIGLFLTLAEPTKAMTTEAAAAGIYTSPTGKKYPRVQILTIAGLLAGTHRAEHPDYEPDLNFKKAKAEKHGEQPELL